MKVNLFDSEKSIWDLENSTKKKKKKKGKKEKDKSKKKNTEKKEKNSVNKKEKHTGFFAQNAGVKPEFNKGNKNNKKDDRHQQVKPNLVLDYKEAFEFEKSNAFEVKYNGNKMSGIFIRSSKSSMIRLSDSENLMNIIKSKDTEEEKTSTTTIKENLKFLPIKLNVAKPVEHFKKLKED